MSNLQLVANHMMNVTGVMPNIEELVSENDGDELRALKVLANAYFQACISTNTPVRKIKCIQNTLDMRQADIDLAAKYDI